MFLSLSSDLIYMYYVLNFTFAYIYIVEYRDVRANARARTRTSSYVIANAMNVYMYICAHICIYINIRDT